MEVDADEVEEHDREGEIEDEGYRMERPPLHDAPFIIKIDPPFKRWPSVVTWNLMPTRRSPFQSLPSVVTWNLMARRSSEYEGVQRLMTEYRARYRSPSVQETCAARRVAGGKYNKDASWRAGIATVGFAPDPFTFPGPGAYDSASSVGFVPEPFTFPGPGAYEPDEGIERMQERTRVPPSFGIGQRFSARWSLTSARGIEWFALHHEAHSKGKEEQRASGGEDAEKVEVEKDVKEKTLGWASIFDD